MAPKRAEDIESLEDAKAAPTSDADLVPDAGKVHLGACDAKLLNVEVVR
jgi:hypothetical protein